MSQNGPVAKAKLVVLDKGNYRGVTFKENDSIEVQFNPNEYSISLSSGYKKKSKKSDVEDKKDSKEQPKNVEFFHEEPIQLSVNLFFDTQMQGYLDAIKDNFKETTDRYEKKYEDKKNVNAIYLKKLMALTCAEKTSKKQPRVKFCWGTTSFKGYVTSIDISYKRFDTEGVPTRAEVSLKMSEFLEGMMEEDSKETSKKGLTGDVPMS